MKALIVTGEASGDLYGGNLANSLKSRIPLLQIAGMGVAAVGVAVASRG